MIPLPRFFVSPLGRIVVAVASLAVLLPVVTPTARHNVAELVQPIGIGLEALAIMLGIAAGVLLAEAWKAMWRQGGMILLSRLALGNGVTRTGHNVRADELASRNPGGWLLMLVLTIGAVLSATKLAREAVLWRAFAGVTATAVPERFIIVDKVHEGRRTRAHLEVRLATGGRTFNVRVSSDAFAAARIGGTLLLPVETGRGGVQRTAPPAASIERADLKGATSGAPKG